MVAVKIASFGGCENGCETSQKALYDEQTNRRCLRGSLREVILLWRWPSRYRDMNCKERAFLKMCFDFWRAGECASTAVWVDWELLAPKKHWKKQQTWKVTVILMPFWGFYGSAKSHYSIALVIFRVLENNLDGVLASARTYLWWWCKTVFRFLTPREASARSIPREYFC